MIGLGDAAALVLAGTAAGTIGTAGGVTSLVSYPALLAVGVPALPADVANIVAVVACWPGSAMASRVELDGQRAWLQRWMLLVAVGGALGAVLLLSTPHHLFARIVPVLVALTAIGMLLQPRLSRWRAGRSHPTGLLLPVGLLAASIYNGYFGAGSGIMVLALLLLATDSRMATANALKNMLIGAASIVSAAALVLFSHVEWSAVVPLSIGMFAGSLLGPRVARRLSADVLRRLVAGFGFALAIVLWQRGA